MQPVICVCLSATFQYTIVFDRLSINEVNRTRNHFLSPSGKGFNVARILSNDGVPARVVTHLGGPRLEEFLALSKSDGIDVRYAPSDSAIRTCVTVVDKENRTSTELVEETYEVDPSLTDAVQEIFLEELGSCSAVVISGTRASGYRSDVYAKMAQMAHERNVMTVLDIKGADLLACLPYRPSVIKPNLHEFAETFLGKSDVMENDANENLFSEVRVKAKALYDEYGCRSVITRGRFDTWVYDGTDLKIVENIDVPVVNTIGCGDTLTAYMVSTLLSGGNLLEAVRRGMDKATERAVHIELL